MGIWYGASIVSVVETLEIIIDLLKIVFRKKPVQSDEPLRSEQGVQKRPKASVRH